MFLTEDGGLPRDWQMVPIRDITLRTSQRDPRKQPDSIFRYVDVSSVDNALFKIRSATEIKGALAPSRARKDIRGNDVLFATVRPTLKRVALVPPALDGEIASTGYCVLRPNVENVVPSYLYDCLLTDWFISAMGKLERGANYPAVRDRDVLNAEIPLPPLPEQRKIAEVLGVVQRAIEQQERLLQLTAELKKTLLHQLFTHGLRGEPQKQTEIGPVPETWEVVRLAELLEIKHGYAFEGKFFAPQGRYVLLTPGHFFENGGFRDQKDKTKFYTGRFPNSYVLAMGDLLVAMTEQKAGLLGSSIIIPESARYLHNQRLGLIQNLDESRLRKLFLYHFFNTDDVRNRIAITGSGSKVRHTSPGKIRDLSIALPGLEEQGQIVTTLQAVDAKLDLLGRKHVALTDLFRSLLHQLMTAQIRVHELELYSLNAGTEGVEGHG